MRLYNIIAYTIVTIVYAIAGTHVTYTIVTIVYVTCIPAEILSWMTITI